MTTPRSGGTHRYLVRFSECVALQESGTEMKKQSRLPLWIESYGIDGSPVGEVVPPLDHDLPEGSSRSLRFCGIMGNGRFVFTEDAYVYGPASAPGKLTYVRLIVVDPAVPRITRWIDLSSAGMQASSNIQKVSGADVVIQIVGNGEVGTMAEAEADRELLVRAISLTTGRDLWRHRETVKMRKLK